MTSRSIGHKNTRIRHHVGFKDELRDYAASSHSSLPIPQGMAQGSEKLLSVRPELPLLDLTPPSFPTAHSKTVVLMRHNLLNSGGLGKDVFTMARTEIPKWKEIKYLSGNVFIHQDEWVYIKPGRESRRGKYQTTFH